jgi:cytidine deaminase
VYGPGFFLVGAYSPTEERIAALATKLAGSHQSADSEKFLEKASKLIERDQFERHNPNGQQVRETFSKADFFVAVDDKVRAAGDIRRFIEIIFGHPNHTPSQDELSMFHAHAAATRSSSLARQVGAVVVSQAGEIISTGTNEAPKAGGGFYWPSDAVHDKRDFVLGHDSNTQMKIRAVREILACLGENGWLSDHSGVAKDGVPDEAVGNACEILKDCRIMNLTEFGREVHAEMAALLDAARRGVPVKDCILYCTTFPCHNCAKHIIASGICRVYYIEPYPKSLATELHGDAIAIEKVDRDRVPFLPFLGVGARRYLDLFSMVNSEGWSIRRKHSDGTAIEWDSSNSVPRLPMWDGSYTDHETASLTAFAEKLSAARADADLERGE